MTDLGSLGGSDGYSEGYGISGDGSIAVGQTSFSNSDPYSEHAFKWTSGSGMVDLGTLLPNNDGISNAWGISSNGAVIVGESNYTESELDPGAEHAVYWDTIGIHDLGTLVGPDGSSHATATNADGSVIVGDSNFTGGQDYEFQAALWKNGTITDLGTLTGAAESESTAWGVDGDGGVVVGQSDFVNLDSSSTFHAFMWTPGDQMQDLGTLANDAESVAYGVDYAGDVIVGESAGHAFRWTSGGMVDLGALNPVTGDPIPMGSFGESVAYGVSGDGAVVVGTTDTVAFRWTAGTGMKDLNRLLASAGVDMTGIELGTAQAASFNGQYITGIGAFTSDSANDRAYVLRYCGGGDDDVSCTSSSGGGGTGPIGGVTTAESVQASIDEIADERRCLLVREDAAAGALIGDGEPTGPGTEFGVYGQAGSDGGVGAFGRFALGAGLSLSGGFGWDDQRACAGAESNGSLGALALRYRRPGQGWQPFAQIGGWVGFGGEGSFSRTYVDGAGTATGSGQAGTTGGGLSLRAGLNADDGTDETAVWGEIGRLWLASEAYGEPLSGDNPFDAAFAGTTDAMDAARLAAEWTHKLTPKLSDTLWAAGALGFDSASGFGTVAPDALGTSTWLELGDRLRYQATASVDIDVFGNGVFGSGGIGSGADAGIALVARL